MTQVLIDTNVIIDWLNVREPFATDAKAVIAMAENRTIAASIAAVSLTNIYYITRVPAGAAYAADLVSKLRRIGRIIACDDELFDAALKLPFDDFEDAVQAASAQRAEADFIVTRNLKDFQRSPIPAVDPATFLARTLE